MPAPEYRPQLATLVKEAPEGDAWLHEVKYDGYRIGCRVAGGRATLYSRNGNDWTAALPEIAGAAGALRTADCLLDGEVVVVLPDGRTSFQALQNALGAENDRARASLVYFVFDLLRLDGERIEALPVEDRKARLRALIGRVRSGSRIRYADHVAGGGPAFFERACRLGLEGIVSKRRDQPYRPGRNDGWLKTKCVQRQEFVISGFTDPEGGRAGLGALLVGFYDDRQRLVFAGRVGTGFTQRSATELRKRLEAIERADSPFAERLPGALARRAHWVEPRLVGEVMFTEWTADGRIRHPSFQGLRSDKSARDVRREAAAVPAAGGRRRVLGIEITHPDRVIYPDLGLTKIDLARYYERVGDWIMPHLRGRPLTLVRCPGGLPGGCFYMKHSTVPAPAPLRRVRIQEQRKVGEYLIADDAAGAVALVQMGVIELHTWNSDYERLEQPNRIVLDLDPGEGIAWAQIVEAARAVRRALQAFGLESFVKTTGGRGLHVVVPVVPHAGWRECLAFAKALAAAIARADPARYTTEFAKTRRTRRILIDYLRNNRTNTSVAAYSTRAKPHAPVSVALSWRELTAALDPASFTIRTVPRRLSRLRTDPWASYWTVRQKLTRQMVEAVSS